MMQARAVVITALAILTGGAGLAAEACTGRDETVAEAGPVTAP